ncbi:MAG: hypothetical protein KF830_14265 [Planctomycetes bacterium]|nr:hypothetical protein [Planctomycetota bacterium]
MKHPAASNPPTDDLPGFLDEGHDHAAETAATRSVEPDDESTRGTVDDEVVAASEGEDEAAPQAAAADAADDAAPAAANAAPTAGGGLLLLAGAAVLAFAALLPTAFDGSPLATTLLRFGLGGPTWIVLGAVLLTGGTLLRRLSSLPRGTTPTPNDDWSRTAQESLQFLVAAQQASNERPPAAGEELQHVLMAMQRQEEKINNLTKAIKMYGKPLMEIASQTTDLAAAVTQTRAGLEGRTDTIHAALERLEARTGDDDATRTRHAELRDALHVVAADVDKLAKRPAGPALEPLQQQLGRLEVAVTALGQRLESSEVQKSLLRLEEATQKAREEVQQLRGDGLGKATTQLQDRLDKATKGLADGLQQLRDGNLGGLESGVRELQRELHGVATAVAQIQAAVRTGARPAPVAPVAPVAPAATSAASAPTPAAAPAPAPAPVAAPAGGHKADDGNAGYKTGTRASSGKNVLGAIAKLKQMKN